MYLIWSDTGDNDSTNYYWNQIEIEILLKEYILIKLKGYETYYY